MAIIVKVTDHLEGCQSSEKIMSFFHMVAINVTIKSVTFVHVTSTFFVSLTVDVLAPNSVCSLLASSILSILSS